MLVAPADPRSQPHRLPERRDLKRLAIRRLSSEPNNLNLGDIPALGEQLAGPLLTQEPFRAKPREIAAQIPSTRSVTGVSGPRSR
jgi:hypothetical protein